VEHTTNIVTNLTIYLDQVGTIADQTSGFCKLAKRIDRGQRVLRRQCYDLFTLISEEYIVPYEESVGPLLNKGSKCSN